MGSSTGWPMPSTTHHAPLGTDERLEFVVEGRLITGSGDHGVRYVTGCTNANCAAWGLRCVDASAEGTDVEDAMAEGAGREIDDDETRGRSWPPRTRR
jgi:hypothetical protein